MAEYYTISHEGKGLVREKMSRFLSFALKIVDAEDAKSKIKDFQNRYHDARHVCWAYMLGAARDTWQLNDNGEPSGTAGKPILGQINSRELTDVLVVVVRYFGGIKLGTSGLIAAYKEAASQALDDAGKEQMHEMVNLKVTVDYILMDGVMRVVKSEGLDIMESNYDNLCTMVLRIKKADEERLSMILIDKGASVET